jgi:hypothetical protein
MFPISAAVYLFLYRPEALAFELQPLAMAPVLQALNQKTPT